MSMRSWSGVLSVARIGSSIWTKAGACARFQTLIRAWRLPMWLRHSVLAVHIFEFAICWR